MNAERIIALATERFGFSLAGVCAAERTAHEQAFRDWLAVGKHGEMRYLADHADVRIDPELFLPGIKSFIMLADQYATRNDERAALPRGQGRIARYAQGRDYHTEMKKRLHALCDELRAQHPQHRFRAFVDTAPVLEREHALRAGLGWIGKHTLLIHPERGSWLLLGGIATTLELVRTDEDTPEPIPDHCGSCTRCIDACPTDAITPYSVDATCCISYLTIEHRSAIPAELAPHLGEWLFGCDICQEVCPHNSPRGDAVDIGTPHPAYASVRTSFDLLDVLGWTEADRRNALKGSAMKRAKLDMWQRNAWIALESRSP